MLTRRQIIFAVPALVFLTFYDGNSSTNNYLRRLAVHCIHSVYATPETALDIPAIPPEDSESLPAYLALCQEWIRHDAYYNETHTYDKYRIVEDEDTCMDWSAPHLNMMEIFAALAVTARMRRIKYRHNCDRTRTFDEAKVGFDYTTIQQVFNTPGIALNKHYHTEDEVKQQCRKCLIQFDPQMESTRVKAKGVHHCLVFPDDHGRDPLDAASIPEKPKRNLGTVALSGIVDPLRTRLYHSATEWQTVTDKPPLEEESGVIIWIDATSIGVGYETMANYIDIPATSISILAGPTCATAILPTGELCYTYAQGLADFFDQQFPSLSSSGYEDSPGVSFKIITSTAAAYSRMILTARLLCPPRSPTCYIPALGKMSTLNDEAILLEDPSWNKAVDFFRAVGSHGVVKVTMMQASDIPHTYTDDEVRRRERELARSQNNRITLQTKEQYHLLVIPPKRLLDDDSERRMLPDGTPAQFSTINALVDHEGYPVGLPLVEIPTDEVVNGLTDQQILDDLAIAINRFNDNPNAFAQRLEYVPTLEEVQEAIANGAKITVNQLNDDSPPTVGLGNGDRLGPDRFRHGELATDADTGFATTSGEYLGLEYWASDNIRRHESLLRIQHDWEVSFFGHAQYDDNDPSTLYEVHCPSISDTGGTVTYNDGEVETESGDKIIISNANDGIVFKFANGTEIATGITSIPVGTAYVGTNTNGYYIKQDGDTDDAGHDLARRVLVDGEENSAAAPPPIGRKVEKIELKPEHFQFTEDLHRVCSEMVRNDNNNKTD